MLQDKRARAAAWVLAAVFLLLRFVHLAADYPRWMRWDDGIATDEGWYASAAINHALWHSWRLPGDMNIPVLMPVWSGVLSIVFRLFGFGLVQARTAAVLFFFACAALLLLLLRRLGGGAPLQGRGNALPLLALMLACNPWAFTFSRSSFLEFPMLLFFLGAAWLAGSGGDISQSWLPRWQTVLAGALFGTALLTKTTALPLLLPLLYLLALRWGFRLAHALPDAAGLLAGAGLVYGAAWLLLVRHYLADVHFYLDVVPSGFHLSPRGVLADGTRPFRYGLGSDHLLFPLTLVVLLASAVSRRVRMLWRDPLFAFPAVWFMAFLALMVQHNNDPARYFAVVIPAVLLLAIAVLRHLQATSPRLYRWLLLLLLTDVAVNAAQVCLFLATPRYSFRDSALAIRNIVQSDPGGNHVVLGDNAHEVALVSGLAPLNLLFHSTSIVDQMDRYQPGWWLQFQPQDDASCFRAVLAAGYTAEKRGAWPLFYPGSGLTLWRLHRIGPLPSQLTEAQRRACLPPIEGVSTYSTPTERD